MKVSGGWLTVNRACNMRCPWCYASSTKYDPKATMPLDLAKQLIDLFSGLGIKNIVVLGGEPTVYPHLFDVLRYAIGRGIKPVIVTNGKRLASMSYAIFLKETGLRELTISLKSVDNEGYLPLSQVKDNALFRSVCTAVANVRSLNFGLNLSVTLVQNFYGRSEELAALLVQLNPNHITIDMGSPVVTPKGMDAAGILNPNELSRELTSLHKALGMTSLSYSFNVSIPLCIIDESVKREIIQSGRVLTTCHVPKGKGLVFTPEGQVVLCNHFSSFPIGQFGVDFKNADEFNDFWVSEPVTELRSRVSVYPHERCQSCPDWNICGGGCFVKWLHWSPETFIPKERR